ncbi:MFS transporter [Actinoplanes sp. ATCC 53533]|uniref:MFS transporter n=1 Tax=Actinoplanes sp. ATCC 53533 TaxID=1288362 RepID=UPI001F1B24BA|nr:MFS transporter [Actinoplanes sp. ATCC 53533]
MGDVRRAWTAYAVSQAGSGIGTGALPLVAILILGSSDWQVSMLAAVAGIAGAAVVVPLGPWVEFHRKRPAMIAADVLRCATLTSVPVAAWLGALTYAQLCLVAAVQTVGVILSSAAGAPYLKGMVPGDRLAVVNSRWETTMWTASTIGPPVGGMLVSAFGALAAIVVDAASFLLSAMTLGWTRHREPAPATPARRRHWLAEMIAGWHHIAAHPVLRALFVHALLFGGCLVASTPLIAVLMLRELGFSPAQYGLALGIPCAAGVLGSLLAPRIIRQHGLMPTLLAAGAARCLWMIVFPVAPGSAAGLALIIGADTMLLLCAGVFNPAFATYRMQAVDDGYLARVTAAWAVSSKVAQPIVIAAAGLAAAVLGARTALVVLAGVLLASVVLLPWKAWRPSPGSEHRAVPDLQTGAVKR